MFLKCYPNPHQSGRMTRAVMLRTQGERHYAIDAETLHKQPELLNAFGRHSYLRMKLLDGLAYMACLIGVLASLSVVWWMFVPGLAVCVMMLATNRKTAGEIARRATYRSVDAFRSLHEMGVLWLVRG